MKLSRQRRNVLIAMANGLPRAKMAKAMHITEASVATHVAHLFKILGVHDRGHAVAIGYNERLLTTADLIRDGQCTGRLDLVICRCQCGACAAGRHEKHREQPLWRKP